MLLHGLEPEVLTGRARDGVFLTNLFGNRFSLSLRALETHARLKPSYHAPHYVVAIGHVVRYARSQPNCWELFHVGLRRKKQLEAWSQHAHDNRRHSVCYGNR